LKRNAPLIGASIATVAAPEVALPLSLLMRPAAAFTGGAAGAALAGSDEPMVEGGVQALYELLGAPQATMKPTAKSLMATTVPERVRTSFPQVDVPQALLERGAVPGLKGSQERMAAMGRAANVEREAAALTAPPINPVGVVSDYRQLYQDAKRAAEPERAREIFDAAKRTVEDVRQTYPRGMPGPAQLARKDIKQGESGAALRGSDALTPNLKDAERSALVRNLRTSDRMSNALDASQTGMAVDEVMDRAAGDSVFKRLKGSGAVSALTGSPTFNAAAAQALYHGGSKALDPNTARLLMSLLNQRSNEEQ